MRWLGRVIYAHGLALQDRLVKEVRSGATGDTLLLLEHPAVITLGRGANRRHLLTSTEELGRRGIEFHETGRGGDITYHGPGQLVGYPIIALPENRRDAHRYLRDLEEALIRSAAEYGIQARRVAGLTGIWVDEMKLAAIGVRFSTGWITSHGFALNVSTDLAGFDSIVPCGISDRGVTSLQLLLGRSIDLASVAAVVARNLSEVLGFEPPTLQGTP